MATFNFRRKNKPVKKYLTKALERRLRPVFFDLQGHQRRADAVMRSLRQLLHYKFTLLKDRRFSTVKKLVKKRQIFHQDVFRAALFFVLHKRHPFPSPILIKFFKKLRKRSWRASRNYRWQILYYRQRQKRFPLVKKYKYILDRLLRL